MKKTESTFEQKKMEKTVADWMWGAIWEAEDALLTEHKNEMAGLRDAKDIEGFWTAMKNCAGELFSTVLENKRNIDEEDRGGMVAILYGVISELEELYEVKIGEWTIDFKNEKTVDKLESARLSVIKSTMETEIRALMGR